MRTGRPITFTKLELLPAQQRQLQLFFILAMAVWDILESQTHRINKVILEKIVKGNLRKDL